MPKTRPPSKSGIQQTHRQPNRRQPNQIDLSFQTEKEEKDDFLPDESIDEYIDESMDNPLGSEPLGTPIEDNSGDEHDRVNLRALRERQRVMYVVDAAHRAGFMSLADAFIAQLCNFTRIQEDGLSVVRSAMYRPELKSLRILLRKDKDVCSYVKRYALDLINREMSSIVHLKDLRLKSSHLSLEKILNFSFSTLDQLHFDQAPFIRSILRTCTSSSTEVLSGDLTDLIDDETPDIRDEMVLYRENLDQFPLLGKRQNSWQNHSLIAVVALCLLCYAQSEKSNIFQATAGHAAFAHNIPKRAVETFHQMGLLVSYESIRRALAANANAVEAELREKVQKYRFFISYDNMNFYEHVRDARIFN